MSIPLGGLRSTFDRFLAQACTVQRYTEVNTPDGVSQGWADVATGVPCLVAPRAASAVERAAEGVERGVSDWTVWLPALTDVTRRDRLAVAAPDGRTFEVERVDARTNEVARACQCVLVE